jgi:hypothetical protein
MSEHFAGRLRIEGKPDETRGYMLTVHDAETGEPITNVVKVTLYLSVDDRNYADVVYSSSHQKQPLLNVLVTNNPEVAVTAFEGKPVEGKGSK